MANFFATGHGLIGSYLARQEADDKTKRINDALGSFMMNNGLSPQSSPQPVLGQQALFPDFKRKTLELGFGTSNALQQQGLTSYPNIGGQYHGEYFGNGSWLNW